LPIRRGADTTTSSSSRAAAGGGVGNDYGCGVAFSIWLGRLAAYVAGRRWRGAGCGSDAGRGTARRRTASGSAAGCSASTAALGKRRQWRASKRSDKNSW